MKEARPSDFLPTTPCIEILCTSPYSKFSGLFERGSFLDYDGDRVFLLGSKDAAYYFCENGHTKIIIKDKGKMMHKEIDWFKPLRFLNKYITLSK